MSARASSASARAFVLVLALALALVACPPGHAQDFAAPESAAPSGSALALLERGLAPEAAEATLEAMTVRWFALESFATRAVALGAGWGTLRAAAGVSRTGDPELGWTTAGLALGAAGAPAGVALRAVARRDLDPPRDAFAPSPGIGAEAGGGAWMRVGTRLSLWVSAPQLWRHAPAPPLARALEIGAALDSEIGRVWIARRAPPPGSGDSERLAGAEFDAFPVRLWLEARDPPLRGRVGCDARVGRLFAGVAVEGHPVLGETIVLALAITLRGEPR
jgi:hypothetical protein